MGPAYITREWPLRTHSTALTLETRGRLAGWRGNMMVMQWMTFLGVVVVAAADGSGHLSYGARPPAPHHHPEPSYGHEPEVPACADNTTKPWCLEDTEYPLYEIKHAIQYHFAKVIDLYADVADLNTELSVERPDTLDEETYLCPSETAYVRPLRAINTDGKWRVIVNNVETHYKTLTQTTRVEECLTAGDACPLVPECHDSSCLQKSIYHRFLVFDPYDQYFPFTIETFKLPASCACLLGASTLDH
ncbi:neurotrophin 1-like [Eriocheir sinensis]|uniref:neurotrophin 1-like n=1 Tax=Eriocheir sinensis TaxID=95602 RepID=UPI0021C86DE5|nr:neurotrophin 1-like [Eriocheir sinensis]